MLKEETKMKILKAIGTRGRATKYDIERSTTLSHSTIYANIPVLLNEKYIEEAGKEEFPKIKGKIKVYYRLTTRGITNILPEIQDSEIKAFVRKNEHSPLLDPWAECFKAEIDDLAYFYINAFKNGISCGIINPELIGEEDVGAVMVLCLARECFHRREWLSEKIEEKQPLSPLFKAFYDIGGLYPSIARASIKNLSILKKLLALFEG